MSDQDYRFQGPSQAQLNEARVLDRQRAQMRGKPSGNFKHRQVDMLAFMNAVNSEGTEVNSEAADGYWRDQERIYGLPTDSIQPAGMRNRLGMVKERTIFHGDGTRTVIKGK